MVTVSWDRRRLGMSTPLFLTPENINYVVTIY